MGYDPSLDAGVAIKVLAENWQHDDDIRLRFTEEARILWRLDSDRIIRVHTVDELPDERPYFVMDFADGGTLAERMDAAAGAARRWTIGEAIGLSVAIADGLAVAHAHGIIHRDLKPSNVMFKSGRDGERLVLADFGIARSLEAAGRSTIAAGTPHYMAPEQSEGRADRASDVYAAAVVLYELLAGTVPFPYPSAGQVIRAQLTSAAPDIRSLRADVPGSVATVLARGLQSDPAVRFATIEDWRDGLVAAVAGNEEPTIMRAAGAGGAETVHPAELAPTYVPPTTPPGPSSAWGPPVGPPAPPPPPTVPPTATGPTGPTGPPPRRRSSPRRWVVAAVVLVVLGLVGGVLAVVLGGGSKAKAGEIFLQPASAPGPDPFGPSIAAPISPAAGVLSSAAPTTAAAATTGPLVINAQFGGTPELYGGSKQLGVCDKPAMISFLQANPDKAAAWAAVQGIPVSALPEYITKLTPVVLRSDTRVTNHGFVNGKANPFQAILQAGTAVLVDEYGVPRARCACGNPLAPPVAVKAAPSYQGSPWPGFSPTNVTVINKNTTVIINMTVVDIQNGQPIALPIGSAASGTSTAATTPSATPTSSTPAPVDLTKIGAVKASSEYPDGQSPTSNATDGNPATSWFSAGAQADRNGASFTWTAPRNIQISTVRVIGNEQNATIAFRHNEGFNQTEVKILNAAGAVVFDQANIPGPGNNAPDVTVSPNVLGSVIQLLFTGHEDPACGGFSELQVIGSG